jgi:hypothetical protein
MGVLFSIFFTSGFDIEKQVVIKRLLWQIFVETGYKLLKLQSCIQLSQRIVEYLDSTCASSVVLFSFSYPFWSFWRSFCELFRLFLASLSRFCNFSLLPFVEHPNSARSSLNLWWRGRILFRNCKNCKFAVKAVEVALFKMLRYKGRRQRQWPIHWIIQQHDSNKLSIIEDQESSPSEDKGDRKSCKDHDSSRHGSNRPSDSHTQSRRRSRSASPRWRCSRESKTVISINERRIEGLAVDQRQIDERAEGVKGVF